MSINNDELNELRHILESQDIITVFQPIVSLSNGNVIGYEALSRGPEGSRLHYPDKLFSVAESYGKTWNIELLCRIKAIERSRLIDKDKLLFINVDPHIFKDEKFQRGFTKEFLEVNKISPETIIFEITEKTSIEDYRSFKAAIDNYIEQGYKIAIDDTGSGYSGLKLITETKPHYIKIDMDLIRDIDKDTFKQALIKAFIDLSKVTKMSLIAEGIETKEELITLIDLGVDAGQGYFLQRPAGTFLDIPENIKSIIIGFNKIKQDRLSNSNNYIGQIARKNRPFFLDTQCRVVKEHLETKGVTGVCIIKDDYPIGLVMKHSLDAVLATQYGVAVYSKRPIYLVMDKDPLIVDYNETVSDVSEVAMERKTENVYDHIVVTKDNKYYGIVTVKDLLEFTIKLERTFAQQLNPLTGLPGNAVIENMLNDLIKSKHVCCVLYIDLDNFKVYNDTYGFENGDKLIKLLAEVIKERIKFFTPYNNFIGHIGGDDFICIVENTYDMCCELCNGITSDFDSRVLDFFSEKDKENGYIEGSDRNGDVKRFNLTSVSIAGIFGNLGYFPNPEEVSKEVSKVKLEAKRIKGSCYILKKLE